MKENNFHASREIKKSMVKDLGEKDLKKFSQVDKEFAKVVEETRLERKGLVKLDKEEIFYAVAGPTVPKESNWSKFFSGSSSAPGSGRFSQEQLLEFFSRFSEVKLFQELNKAENYANSLAASMNLDPATNDQLQSVPIYHISMKHDAWANKNNEIDCLTTKPTHCNVLKYKVDMNPWININNDDENKNPCNIM
ncbi:hypothetical protein [Legionella fairfieldensis]|uniref:hypothetical protein n=1 Tax=Legionella fairfieldensis TaxID=45064 RepID=UPI00048D13FF|nr:hypothetical protein [Legionella fairfieldensis]